MEKLLENEAPLVTLVNMIGAFDANPISTYTRNIEKNHLKDVDTRILFRYILRIFPKNINLLCRPVLTPQIAGIGGPPDTTNWSF